jgi:hypothetical protein
MTSDVIPTTIILDYNLLFLVFMSAFRELGGVRILFDIKQYINSCLIIEVHNFLYKNSSLSFLHPRLK